MTHKDRHPEDFSPYLDGDVSDPRFEEVRRHLVACRSCREELDAWRALEGMMRADALEVPPYQWQRIRARIGETPRRPWYGQVLDLVVPRRLAWNVLAGAALVTAVTLAGIEYQNSLEEKELLSLITYSEPDQRRLINAENPFRSYLEAPRNENPFTRVKPSGPADWPGKAGR